MRGRHLTLVGLALGLALILFATIRYPGGSQHDAFAPGFDWKHNYLSDLFTPAAVNGAANASRNFAIPGVLVLCATLARFFRRFSKGAPTPALRRFIAIPGVAAMVFAALACTPLHDAVLSLASTAALLAFFSVVVLLARSGRYPLLALGVATLLVSYITNYVYFARQFLEWLPTLQKISLSLLFSWVLSLEYTGEHNGWDRAPRPA